MSTIYTDLLVIGAGLAGERAAVAVAAEGHDVILLSLVPPRRSHSSAAQGGMQASLANSAKGAGDNTDVHFHDTVKGSDWGCEQDVARLFVETAPIAVREMSHWGVPWNRVVAGKKRLPDGSEIEDSKDKEGLIAARNFGGTAKWRTCYCADGTGHSLLMAMDNKVAEHKVPVHDRTEAISLIVDGNKCCGAIVQDLKTGELKKYVAKATMIATGGYGRIYGVSTNAVICEGTGASIVIDTEVGVLGNMEAVQFHPTGIVPSDILVTEGCRGDGGYLLDKDMHRFMPDYEPKAKELASRDVVSRRMMQHMRKGKGVQSKYGEHLWLDIRHLGKKHIETYLREVQEICENFLGIDPVKDLIPVRPTQHYTMGGVRTDITGHSKNYGLEGLFSAGEAACWDMHGFNRLGGNSVAETVVAGKIVGESIAKFLKNDIAFASNDVVEKEYQKQVKRVNEYCNKVGTQGESVYVIKKEMEETLTKYVHVFRNEADLTLAVNKLKELYKRADNISLRASGKNASPELCMALRIKGMLKLAICVATGALTRTESRGSHFREDYPTRDDQNWLKRSLYRWPDASKDSPELFYEPVNITELPPGDRGYGEGSANAAKK